LLDEPSEGLAPVVIDQIVDALHTIRANGTGLVIVEQHLSLVRRVAERFVVLVKGEVRAGGEIADIDAPELQEALAL
jgi:branched-chain amino acid transport system ATP-binding protein